MAPIFKSFALASALLAASSSAAPLARRNEAVVWETVTTVVWETVDVTTTVTDGPTPYTSTVAVVNAQPTTAAPVPVEPASSSTTQAAAPTVAPPAPVEPPATTQAPAPPAPPAPTAAPPPPPPPPQQPPAPEPSSSSGGAPASTGAPSSGPCTQGSPCSGMVTFYDTATSASAPSSCGFTNDGETESVLALPHGIMTDADCGKTVSVSYGGVTVSGKVVDKCMGCDNNSIDLSRHFFGLLAPLSDGRLHGVDWYIQ